MKKITFIISVILVVILGIPTFANNYEIWTNENGKKILKSEIDYMTYFALKKVICKGDPVLLNNSKYLRFKNFSVELDLSEKDGIEKEEDRYFVNVYIDGKSDYENIIKQDKVKLSIPQKNPDNWEYKKDE